MVQWNAIKFFFFTASLALSTGYPYNDHKYFFPGLKNPYPDTCCQLEWTDISQGDPLPEDYVHAGRFMNRDWAFLGTEYGNIAAKSNRSVEEPNWMMAIRVRPYPILTNPNKCSLGWYRTRFNKEEIPRNQEWFFPPLSVERWVSFGQYQGIPAKIWNNGDVDTLSSLMGGTKSKPENYDLLYVDCKKSILSMSKAKLYNITYSQKDFENLKSVPTRVTYTKKFLVNTSPLPSKSSIKFQIETFDNASLKLGQSFSSFFKTDTQTYKEWSVGGKVSGFLNSIGFEAGGGTKHETWKNTESGNSNSEDTEIFRATARRELFEFAQEVQIPPYSKTTLIAYSKPIQGNIPFTAIYELFPTGNQESNNAKILEASLKKYGMDQKMERTDRGTLLVHYEGTMHVDAGHEVDVDIQSVKLGNAPPELFL